MNRNITSRFEQVIEKDFEILRNIDRLIRRNRILGTIASAVVSKFPWNDISILIWIVFGIGVIEFGRIHFWIGIINLGLCYAANRFFQAPRPVEFNESFQPLTDTMSESYGFPSIETYMSVVIFFHFTYLSKLYFLYIFAFIFSFLIGFSRLYSRSRFVHQIVGSWMLGVVGLLLSMLLYDQNYFNRLNDTAHGGLIAVALGIFACVFALAIESNESRILSIPKQEYVRVIGGIMKGEPRSEKEKAKNPSSAEQDDALAKRDSFYYLQKSLQERSNK